MYRSKVARVRPASAPLCATFDPLPGRVLTTIIVTRLMVSAHEAHTERVLVCRDLDREELRDALHSLDGMFPREEGYVHTLEARVVQP